MFVCRFIEYIQEQIKYVWGNSAYILKVERRNCLYGATSADSVSLEYEYMYRGGVGIQHKHQKFTALFAFLSRVYVCVSRGRSRDIEKKKKKKKKSKSKCWRPPILGQNAIFKYENPENLQ